MARETFIDTSGFYALLVKRDDMHEKAAQILGNAAKRRARFVTTDYVLSVSSRTISTSAISGRTQS